MLDISLIFDAPLAFALLIALLAGVLSFLSPCILPIVPPYLAFMSGVNLNETEDKTQTRWRVLRTAVAFVCGLSTVFIMQGAAFSTLGQVFFDYKPQLETLSAVLIMLFGAHFIGVFRISFFDRDVRFNTQSLKNTLFGAYLMGLAFAFGWTPCIGPVLAAILSLAASEANVWRGSVLLAVYAFGLGIPFLLVAAFFPEMSGPMAWMKRHMGRIERTSGLLLWTVGLMMLTGQFSKMSFWLLETFPLFAIVG